MCVITPVWLARLYNMHDFMVYTTIPKLRLCKCTTLYCVRMYNVCDFVIFTTLYDLRLLRFATLRHLRLCGMYDDVQFMAMYNVRLDNMHHLITYTTLSWLRRMHATSYYARPYTGYDSRVAYECTICKNMPHARLYDTHDFKPFLQLYLLLVWQSRLCAMCDNIMCATV